jgi:hypothetical protein
MKGFSILDRPEHKGATDVWLTPLSIVNALGVFDLDPCGFPGHKTAKTVWALPEHDGLTRRWRGRVWLNPPYSDVKTWLDRLSEHDNGAALVFARTDTRWAQEHFRKASSVFFMKGRIKFLTSEFVESTNAGHGSMILGYGPKLNFSKFEGWRAK